MFLIWIARLVWIINEIDLINYTHQLGLCRSAMVLELSLVFSSSSFTPSTTNLLLNVVVKMWSHPRSSFPLQMQPPKHEACNLIRPTLPLKFQFLPAITFILINFSLWHRCSPLDCQEYIYFSFLVWVKCCSWVLGIFSSSLWISLG